MRLAWRTDECGSRSSFAAMRGRAAERGLGIRRCAAVSGASDVETVLAWHAALNAADLERLLALSAPDIEVGGPRGSGTGVDLLRDWVARARIRLEPLGWQARDGVVVVEQTAQWQQPDGPLTEPQHVASVFRVRDGKLSSVLRYDNLASALRAAGLDASSSA